MNYYLNLDIVLQTERWSNLARARTNTHTALAHRSRRVSDGVMWRSVTLPRRSVNCSARNFCNFVLCTLTRARCLQIHCSRERQMKVLQSSGDWCRRSWLMCGECYFNYTNDEPITVSLSFSRLLVLVVSSWRVSLVG